MIFPSFRNFALKGLLSFSAFVARGETEMAGSIVRHGSRMQTCGTSRNELQKNCAFT